MKYKMRERRGDVGKGFRKVDLKRLSDALASQGKTLADVDKAINRIDCVKNWEKPGRKGARVEYIQTIAEVFGIPYSEYAPIKEKVPPNSEDVFSLSDLLKKIAVEGITIHVKVGRE